MAARALAYQVLLICVSTSPASACGGDLQEAVSQLQQWQKRIVSLRVQSRVTSNAETNALIRESSVKQAVTELDWIWEDSGRFRDSETLREDGMVGGRSLRLADHRHFYSCSFPPAKKATSEFPTQVVVQENSARNTSMGILRQPFWVLWDDASRTWLGDRLQRVGRAKTTEAGLLEIDGEVVGMQAGYVVRLDPQHGYLPKSAHYSYESSRSDYLVDEFQEVEPGFWFPRTGTIDLVIDGKRHAQSWVVTKVELNPELPDSLFVPPMNRETIVDNTITGKRYQNYPGAAHNNGSIPVRPEGLLPAASTPASANPERSTNWSLWLTVCGVLLVALAVWKSRSR